MSRESELYRDKIEVSLDGRQIFYLFFGGAVIVGLVFVLGVMVGRRVEARGHVERAHTPATVDPLAALDRLEGNGGLSFQGALRGSETPTTAVEKKVESIAKQRQPEGKPEAKADAKPEPKAEPKKLDDKKLEDKKAEIKPEPKKLDDKKLEETKLSEKPVTKPEQVEPKKAEDKKAEDKKVDEKKPEEKKPEEKKSRFALQLSSFQDKSEAQAFLETIKSAGYQAYLTEGEVDGKQYFRVRLGSYRSLEAANDAKSEFERAAKKSALVIKL